MMTLHQMTHIWPTTIRRRPTTTITTPSLLAVSIICMFLANIDAVMAGVFYPRGGSFGVRKSEVKPNLSKCANTQNPKTKTNPFIDSIWQLWPYQWTCPIATFTWLLILSPIMDCHRMIPTLSG